MSDYEKHIGKLKKVDLSEYGNSTERFFEELYRKFFTDLSEEEIKDEYRSAENTYRRNRGPWEYLFFDMCYNFDMEDKFYVVNGNIYETIEHKEVDEASFEALLYRIRNFFAFECYKLPLKPPIYSRKIYKLGFVAPTNFGNSYKLANYKVNKFFNKK